MPIGPDMDVSATIDLERTTRNPFNFQNLGVQFRKQFLDDIAGDFVSLDLGGSMRVMPHYWTEDVAIPYHNVANFEVFTAVGKEYSKDDEWYLRAYGFLAFGQANEGYPWFRMKADFKSLLVQSFALGMGAEGYFGTGPIRNVNVRDFKSYAQVKHESVDLLFNFSYISDIWGTFSLLIDHRIYAKAFPSDFNLFELRYRIPLGI